MTKIKVDDFHYFIHRENINETQTKFLVLTQADIFACWVNSDNNQTVLVSIVAFQGSFTYQYDIKDIEELNEKCDVLENHLEKKEKSENETKI